MSSRGWLWAFVLFGLGPAQSAHADEGWSFLRSENRHAREGNEALKAGDAKGALAAYDRAARELPSEGGVHLDRGLALLKTGELAKAREALQLATQPPAATGVRADAYYNLGNAFYKEGDARAAEDDPEQAQKSFREAADALKQALRLRPGDRNAAWNYELALRRLAEQKQKQEEQQQDPQQQDPQQQDPQQQDPQQQDPQQQDQQQQDPQQSGKDEKPEEQPQQPQQQPAPDDPQQQAEGEPAPQPAIPRDVERALDALEEGEENLERVRAMQRGGQRRPPEKDW
jgi:Ca-activated chloride channel homolog